MSYEEVINWIYATAEEEEDYESKETLIEAIRSKDKLGTVEQWIDNEGYSGGNAAYEAGIQTEIDNYNKKIKKEEIKEEPIIVEIDGEEFEIPVKFQPGRPREEVRDIVAALAGETMEAIFSAETKEQVDEIEIPANIPQSIKNMLNAERKARFKEVPSEEGA